MRRLMIFLIASTAILLEPLKNGHFESNLRSGIMFLCTFSVVIWLGVASSNGQLRQSTEPGIGGSRERYNVPQEIKDRVPVDFAAGNIRNFRLKYQSEGKIFPFVRSVDETSKSTIVKRISSSKYPPEELKGNAIRHNDVSRKRLNKHSSAVLKKSFGSRKNSFQIDTSTRRTVSGIRRDMGIASNSLKKEYSRSRTQSAIRSNALKRKSVNSFEDIKKAINALPQQTVKVLRDDVDCIDELALKLDDTRGPPCTFSARWPGSGGDPWFWFNNVVPQNWELFYN